VQQAIRNLFGVLKFASTVLLFKRFNTDLKCFATDSKRNQFQALGRFGFSVRSLLLYSTHLGKLFQSMADIFE